MAGRDALAAAGDCFAFVTVKNSGHDDLFAPFAVFLVPSLGFSAASIGLQFWLLKRRAVRRTAKLQGLQLQAGQSRRIDFGLLCDRFVLRRRQQRHEELKSANDAERYEAYIHIVLALTEVRFGLLPVSTAPVQSSLGCWQDVPFCALNTILLERTVRSRNDATLLPAHRLCSDEYDTSFLMLLLVLLTSAGMLVYKAMHLLALPRVWAEHERLAAEAAELEECRAAIDRRMGALASETGPSATVRLYGRPAELEQQPIGDSGPMGDAVIATDHGGASQWVPSRLAVSGEHAVAADPELEALSFAVSCAHGAAADPELEVAGKDREMVGRSDPHVRDTACPTHARASAN